MRCRNLVSHFALAVGFVAGAAIAQPAQHFSTPDGGWGTIESPREYISEAEQQELQQTVARNTALLQLQGRLPIASKAGPASQLRLADAARAGCVRSSPITPYPTTSITIRP